MGGESSASPKMYCGAERPCMSLLSTGDGALQLWQVLLRRGPKELGPVGVAVVPSESSLQFSGDAPRMGEQQKGVPAPAPTS